VAFRELRPYKLTLIVIASPDMMAVRRRLGKVLVARGSDANNRNRHLTPEVRACPSKMRKSGLSSSVIEKPYLITRYRKQASARNEHRERT